MIVGKHYKVLSILGKGCFGTVYKAINQKTNEIVAIKTEPMKKPYKLLKNETTILKYLYDQGCRCIPIVYWYGLHLDNLCLAISCCDFSLQDYLKKVGKEKFSEKIDEIMRTSIGMLESIHNNFVLHRDIKPTNFMFKQGELFFIDFGLATFYIDDSGEHIPDIEGLETIIGTPKYVSYHVHRGHVLSRRDDLISLGYMYLQLLFGELPWGDKYHTMDESSYDEILVNHPKNVFRRDKKKWDNLRTFMSLEQNRKIYRYMEYCYSLEYDGMPLYRQLHSLFV